MPAGNTLPSWGHLAPSGPWQAGSYGNLPISLCTPKEGMLEVLHRLPMPVQWLFQSPEPGAHHERGAAVVACVRASQAGAVTCALLCCQAWAGDLRL